MDGELYVPVALNGVQSKDVDKEKTKTFALSFDTGVKNSESKSSYCDVPTQYIVLGVVQYRSRYALQVWYSTVLVLV